MRILSGGGGTILRLLAMLCVCSVLLLVGCVGKSVNTTPGISAMSSVTSQPTVAASVAPVDPQTTLAPSTAPAEPPAKAPILTMQKVQAGLVYLSASIKGVTLGMDIIHTKYPDKYQALYDKIQPILVQIGQWVDAATVAYADSDLTKAVSFYNLARPQFSNIWSILQQTCGSSIMSLLAHT